MWGFEQGAASSITCMYEVKGGGGYNGAFTLFATYAHLVQRISTPSQVNPVRPTIRGSVFTSTCSTETVSLHNYNCGIANCRVELQGV